MDTGTVRIGDEWSSEPLTRARSTSLLNLHRARPLVRLHAPLSRSTDADGDVCECGRRVRLALRCECGGDAEEQRGHSAGASDTRVPAAEAVTEQQRRRRTDTEVEEDRT